jgi:hypothetical protein
MIPDSSPSYSADLRFALQVLDEESHLGLDSQYASQLRTVILKQIAQAEEARKRRPTSEIPARRREPNMRLESV